MQRFLSAVVLTAFAFAAHAAVDANRASQPELETFKGIGPGLSGKIVKARRSGDFKDWNDLVERVGGIGPANATRFSQAGLTVAGQGYAGTSAAPAEKKARKPAADRATR